MIYDGKKELRKKLLAKRESFSDAQIAEISDAIFEKIKKLECFKKAQTVMIYVTFGKELQTGGFIKYCIKSGKRVATPVCNPSNHTMLLANTAAFPEGFAPTKMGILEIPRENAAAIDPQELDIIITPGLAFTMDGDRIGYGGGYYDRLFEILPKRTLLICPTFDDFILESIPAGPYDKKVDMVISEKRSVVARRE
jgi:5-formyltetrahydrofolate cyclo-ligase